jgi:hypothetical protein
VSAPVCSRRVSAGITPAPGTTSRLPVWWGRTDWLEVEVRGALREHVDVCRAHHVSPDTVLTVARAMAGFADAITGRDCRPTNERMTEAARCSLSTVQRARRVLKALGLVVEVVAGRSNMTLRQRLAAHERGSSHRAIAAEFALCSRRNRRPRLVENPAADLQVVDRDTPPVGKVVRTSALEIRGSLQSTDATRSGAARRAHTQEGRRREPGRLNPRARELAEAVRSRVGWLSGVHARRLVPVLSRFALAGWTARDVATALQDARAARGWSRVPDLERPWAYLATLLREVDPADRPGALEEQMDREDREVRRYEQLRVYGPPCPHGMPAGNTPSPHGLIACPFCRGVPDELADVLDVGDWPATSG